MEGITPGLVGFDGPLEGLSSKQSASLLDQRHCTFLNCKGIWLKAGEPCRLCGCHTSLSGTECTASSKSPDDTPSARVAVAELDRPRSATLGAVESDSH